MNFRLSCTLGIAGLLAACAATGPGGAPAQDTRAEVAAFLDGYLKAIETRDEKAVLASFVPGERFAWIEEGRVRYRSGREVVAGLATLPRDTPIRTELKDLTVVSVGHSGAHAWAGFTTTIGSPPRGFSFGGVISMVLEKHEGRWKLVGGHTSSAARPRTP